jgi:hypothetical protein
VQSERALLPSLPVAVGSEEAFAPRPLRELETHDADHRTLAALVRLRLGLERTHGWVLGSLLLALASVALVGFAVHSRLVFGACAAAVASGAAGLGFVAQRVCFGLFRHQARAQGLSERACEQVFERAIGADHWIDVMRACGHEPTDAELASFVTGA